MNKSIIILMLLYLLEWTRSFVQQLKQPSLKEEYISNEIFYRVALLREKYNPTLKTGHIHVGYLRKFDYNTNTETTVNKNKADMMTEIKNAITQAIEIL